MHEYILKRPIDLCVSAVALVLLSPVLLILALVIAWNMGSPVIFKQARIGRNGTIFNLFKFRTMCEAGDAENRSLSDAERLTSLGRALRSSSLDELPELWNVLCGQMSLVGPRPLLVDYLPYYASDHAHRHDVRPGLTGWAQVNGRNAQDWETRFNLDLEYIKRQSFRFDCYILWRTIGHVLSARNVESAPGLPMPRFDDEVKAGRARGNLGDDSGRAGKSESK